MRAKNFELIIMIHCDKVIYGKWLNFVKKGSGVDPFLKNFSEYENNESFVNHFYSLLRGEYCDVWWVLFDWYSVLVFKIIQV